MKYFYAASNDYSNENSMGFANTWRVYAFSSKAARDAFVEDAIDLSTKAITRKEIPQYADKDIIPHGYHQGEFGYIIWINDDAKVIKL